MIMGRNDPCTCGSGKKYKKCCMDLDYYYELFMEQSSLMGQLSDTNVCNEIIAIGDKIVSAKNQYKFTTGAYTNMANAYLHLGLKNSNLESALRLVDKALELKPRNYQALIVRYSAYMLSEKYNDANSVLREFLGHRLNDKVKNSILTTYQVAVQNSMSKRTYSDSVIALKDITHTLFELMDDYGGLWMLAHEFYRDIGDDALKAYELGKKFVEKYDYAEVYASLGFVCINERINRPVEGIKYLNKAIEIAENEEVLLGAKTNLVTAFIKNEDYANARALVEELVTDTPNNANFSNYAELLKREEEYDKAIEWCKKALFLIEDDTTLLVLADTYKKNKQYEEAAESFIKCIGVIESEGNVYRFTDACGTERHSFATNTSIRTMLIESYLGVIESYNRLSEFSKARAYLTIGLENFPNERSLEVLHSVLPIVDDIQSEYNDAKEKLEKEREISKLQRNCIRKWASDLMSLQNSADSYDLDNDDDWGKFEEKMNQVILTMQESVNASDELLQQIEQEVEQSYPNLINKAKEFLKTANYLYSLHRDAMIDFAPIVVEYSKIVEMQLRYKLGTRLTSDEKMLGQILYKIRTEKILPFKNNMDQLNCINELRKKSAHTGVLNLHEANKIRKVLFDDGLILALL